ncbi:MAG TPA: nucleotidyltransferase [Planctomycetota bacterium]|nr:nucleotidyltransferase [Planctomycetota bacterium]
MTLAKDLREFIESLNSHGVEFVVVGAHAVAFHGHPRFTGDLDLLVRPAPENAERVIAALRAFGFTSPGLSAADFLRPDSVVQLGVAPNRIDLLTSITAVGFDEAWAGRAAGALGGPPVSFLGYDALLKNKLATGRSRDAEDVARLKVIRSRERR